MAALFIDQAYYKRWLSDAVEARTGRPLHIEGDLKLAVQTTPGAFGLGNVRLRVYADGVRYPNAEWGRYASAIEVGRAGFAVDLWALLGGQILLREVVLQRPKLWLERHADGVYNMSRGAAPGGAGYALPDWLQVARADIRHGEITIATAHREWNLHIQHARASSGGPDSPLEVDFRGALEGTSLIATAHGGSLADLLAGRPMEVAIDGVLNAVAEGQAGADGAPVPFHEPFTASFRDRFRGLSATAAESRARGLGSVENLLKWRGVDLQIDAVVMAAPALSAIAGVDLPDIGRLRGRAQLVQPLGLASMRLQNLVATSNTLGLLGTARGEIARLAILDGMDLRLTASGAPILPAALKSGLETVFAGATAAFEVDAAATVRGAKGDFKLAVETARAENAALMVAAAGEIPVLGGVWQEALAADFTLKNLAMLGGQKIPPKALIAPDKTPPSSVLSELGAVHGTATLAYANRGWEVGAARLEVARQRLSITASGHMRLTAAPRGRVEVTAAVVDAQVRPWLGPSAPPLTDLALTATLDVGHGGMRAAVHKLEARMYGADFSGRGVIGELHRWRGFDLAVTAVAEGAPGAAAPSVLRGMALAGRGRLVDAADDAGGFDVIAIEASVTDPADRRSTLTVRGVARGLGADLRADLAAEVNLARLAPLQPWLANFAALEPALTALKPLLPVRASANLRAIGSRWTAPDLSAISLAPGLETAALSGQITAFAPLDSSFNLTVGNMAVANLPPAWPLPRPVGGRLRMTAKARLGGAGLVVEHLDVGIDSAAATVTLEAAIAQFQPLHISAMAVEFRAEDIAALGWKNLDFLHPASPAAGRFRVLAGSPGRLSIDIERLNIGASAVRGGLQWQAADPQVSDPQVAEKFAAESAAETHPDLENNPENRPQNTADKWPPRRDPTRSWWHAKLTAKRLDAAEILAPGAPQARFFSAAPWQLGWLQSLDGVLELRADELSNELLDLRAATLHLALQRGLLRQRVDGRMGGGELALTLRLDSHAKPLAVALKVAGRQLDTGGLVAFRDHKYLAGGVFDVDIDVVGQGDSAADLVADAAGGAGFRLERARLRNRALDTIGGDIFANVLAAINPFRTRRDYVTIECGRMRFELKDGLAISDDGLALKTDKVTLFGGGRINLKDETLDLLILPRARQGPGINSSSLVKIVRLGGTLAAPRIEVDADPEKLLKTAAAVWAGLSTGGISLLLKGAWDKFRANNHVCSAASGGPQNSPAAAPERRVDDRR